MLALNSGPSTAEIVPNPRFVLYHDLGHFSIVIKLIATITDLLTREMPRLAESVLIKVLEDGVVLSGYFVGSAGRVVSRMVGVSASVRG
jgi:hypothetical protein